MNETTTQKFRLDDLLDTLEISEPDLNRLLNKSKRYHHEIKRVDETGRSSQIAAPGPELKALQRKIAKRVLRRHDIPDIRPGHRAVHANTTTTVKPGGKTFILHFELLDFFPSISHKRVIGLFLGLGLARKPASLLARATTYKGSLPESAPTSPDIANLVCRTLDTRLNGFCKIRHWTYSRHCG
ncbi:MAG: hypothetical protein K8F91_02380, partial [Candidatus Obscuribacterales bacterium]|nr:hypothetical protein [Candidatus Obscuribacterales bacterium]